MKHDMQIYLDAIHVLAKDGRYDELMTYTEQYYNHLSSAHSTISTGNAAIDCILTTKLDYAKNME